MASDEGASPKEQLIEACRRNNTSLLQEVFSAAPLSSQPATIAQFLNTTTDALGSSAMHVAAQYGAYEALDLILDQEGVEIDGQERRDGDTCLHRAARFASGSQEDWEQGKAVVEILIDAGCDPRIRNNAKLKPVDLVDPRNEELRKILKKAELTIQMSNDLVAEEEEDDDGEPDGPGSESD
ncbi:Ankyrin repeat-containing [Lecanosticta acicola]|uniref:Ankyrin repeat-containing n=1 Tax=Lecanosticta acicola TaxID=111012 RepID=A0AAI8YZX6_9PEZI|nr:Ankyrin repeat-containing [Lecanosticta acicola]